MQGTLKTFQGAGDSGNAVCRRFCPECGSQIIFESDAMPDLTFIQGGTLDDTSLLDPCMSGATARSLGCKYPKAHRGLPKHLNSGVSNPKPPLELAIDRVGCDRRETPPAMRISPTLQLYNGIFNAAT
jgi:hypothetical protein